jgi:hypothetical protein
MTRPRIARALHIPTQRQDVDAIRRQAARDEALAIAAEIEQFRGYLIGIGDRRDDTEIAALYRAADMARKRARRHT